MGWKDWPYWLRGIIIAFIVSLPYIFINFQKSLANRHESESLIIFFLFFGVTALFKISFILIMGAILGLTAGKKKWVLFCGLFGLTIAGFFVEPITVFIFREIMGVTLLESSIYGLITIGFGFVVGALIGWIYGKVKQH